MADDGRDEDGSSQPHIHRPVPRRAFEPHILRDASESIDTGAFQPENETPAASLQESKSSDFLAQLNARLLRTTQSRNDDAPESPVDGALPRQNKSFLNMKSALFGIYDDVGASTEAASVVETPWGTGAETPGHTGMGWHGTSETDLSMTRSAQRASGPRGAKALHSRRASQGLVNAHTRRRSTLSRYVVLGAKLVALFTFGIFYGTIVSHLHDTRQLAAVNVRGVDRGSWFYVVTWGVAGVALGSLLPWVEGVWSQHSHSEDGATEGTGKQADGRAEGDAEREAESSPISEQINDVVRSVAAFVGVAFAIRRLPWQSTLQLTLTLALVNPALWYILDRSKPGLSCSLIVTSLLTSLMYLSNPTAFPSSGNASPPSASAASNGTRAAAFNSAGGRGSEELFLGVMGYESLAVVTWVGSVLFCSCVCFGSIGRRLAVLERGR